jgi:hypothetical protein
LAETHNLSLILIDDTSLSSYETKNINMLDKFLDLSKSNIKISIKRKLITRLRIPKIMPVLSFVSDENFNKSLKRKLPLYILDGYFQDCFTQAQFENTVAKVKKMFIFRQHLKIKSNACVIHVRGGDFVKLGWNIVSPPEYYNDSIKFMNQEFGIKVFYIVTDDEIYAKNIINQDVNQYIFLSDSVDNDFWSIASYPYKILSSSTFSFWACLVGDNSGKVIAPKMWTLDRKRLLSLPNEI